MESMEEIYQNHSKKVVTTEPILFDSKELKQIIRQTSFACATSETRIVLTSLKEIAVY